jgi:hypothetical protein
MYERDAEQFTLHDGPPYANGDLHIGQGLTLSHFSAQPKPVWSHLSVSPCLIDRWNCVPLSNRPMELMHPTYPTKCANIELKSGRV